MKIDYAAKRARVCIGLVLVGILMLIGGLVGYFFTAPIGLLKIAVVVLIGIAIAAGVAVLVSLVELIREWAARADVLTRAELMRGYRLAMIAGFVGCGAMLGVFLLTQELKGASQAEFVTPAVAAIGGLVIGLGALNLTRDNGRG